MNKYTPITLIGFGITGQLLLSYILDDIPGNKITVIDPDFIGGDFVRQPYGSIKSNTTISQMTNKMSDNWSKTVAALKSRGELTDTVRLSDIGNDMKIVGLALAAKCVTVYDKVVKIIWNNDKKRWTLELESGTVRETSMVCLCSGMISRQEDYCIPTIPLPIALDETSLMRIVNPGQRVIVIGSSHSATLVLKNLKAISDVAVACFYRGDKPFRFARDGAYDGIKQESAEIADSILSGEYPMLTLINTSNLKEVCAHARSADWIIQATGFKSAMPMIVSDNAIIEPLWDSKTGLCTNLSQLQAFGACVPDTTTIDEKEYADISISSFIDQLLIRWPVLKGNIQNLL